MSSFSNRNSRERPLVYFYSGDKLPSYWRDSVRVTSRGWSGPIVLLTDSGVSRPPKNVEVIDFTEFFDSRRFEEFRLRSPMDGDFRNGFWFKAVLRFFVFEQFMENYKLTSLLHLELDVPGFSLERIPFELDKLGRGVFVPWLTDVHGIASFVYVNNISGLRQLLRGFSEHSHLGHEMAMLGVMLRDGRGVFGLPTTGTLASIVRGDLLPRNQVPPSRDVGIFDAAPIGHWILGNDPRNQVGRLVRNHFVFDYVDDSKQDLESLRMELSYSKDSVDIATVAGSFSVHCLHIHSKALYLVRWSSLFRWIIRVANRSKSRVVPVIPIAGSFRKVRLVRWGEARLVKLKALVIARIRRPTSHS